MLQKGSTGDEVKRLQLRLNTLGYTDEGWAMLAEDGKFGAKTEQAVNAFKDNVLPGGNTGENRGRVGETTWEYLRTAKVVERVPFLPPLEYCDTGTWSGKDINDFMIFENEKKLQWNGCTSQLLAAKGRFEAACKERGWAIRYTSAYRPLIYQAHFYDIKNGPASKTAAGQRHCLLHGIKSASYPKRNSSPHILGVAFDAIITTGEGRQLNPDKSVSAELLSAAAQCGLRINSPHDSVHFQLR